MPSPRRTVLPGILSAAIAWAPVCATDLQTFVEDQGCIGCHALDEARIGPSYAAIAARYPERDARTVERLARKILAGGAGNWGVVPMIANDRLSLDEARDMVLWILDQRASPAAMGATR